MVSIVPGLCGIGYNMTWEVALGRRVCLGSFCRDSSCQETSECLPSRSRRQIAGTMKMSRAGRKPQQELY